MTLAFITLMIVLGFRGSEWAKEIGTFTREREAKKRLNELKQHAAIVILRWEYRIRSKGSDQSRIEYRRSFLIHETDKTYIVEDDDGETLTVPKTGHSAPDNKTSVEVVEVHRRSATLFATRESALFSGHNHSLTE